MTTSMLPEPYEMMGELGSGGSSVVYKAKDLKSGRIVAIKILINDRFEERFVAEANHLARLQHPNLVTFIEVGRFEGRDFIVMEYLSGGTLHSFAKGKSYGQLLKVFIEVCDGLSYLHEKDLVHRDIKPSNILFDTQGTAKLADLGLCRELGRGARLTKPGQILGTCAYLAPEQIRCQDAGLAADLYGLGVCLFEIFTGRRPFLADSEFVLMKAQLEEKPPNPKGIRSDLPESLAYLILSLLEKDPENRPTNAKVVSSMLERCLVDMGDETGSQLSATSMEQKIARLSDPERSLLLAIAFLGETAGFEDLCVTSALAEDRVDATLTKLIDDGLIKVDSADSFGLGELRNLMESRLRSRLRTLFQARLDSVRFDDRQQSREPCIDMKLPSKPAVFNKHLGKLVLALAIFAVVVFGAWFFSASVSINTFPSGATVIVDERFRGSTPLTLVGLRPGSHRIRLVLDGYLRETRVVSLFARRQENLSVNLRESQARLSIVGLPSGCQLSINGALYDPGEVTDLVLVAGDARIKVKKDGYRPYVRDLTLKSGEPVKLHVLMSPLATELSCRSVPAGAKVFIDGAYKGLTPLDIDKLAYGEHEVEFRMDGYLSFRKKIVVKNDEPLVLNEVLRHLAQ